MHHNERWRNDLRTYHQFLSAWHTLLCFEPVLPNVSFAATSFSFDLYTVFHAQSTPDTSFSSHPSHCWIVSLWSLPNAPCTLLLVVLDLPCQRFSGRYFVSSPPTGVKKHGSLTDSADDFRYSEKAIRKRSISWHTSVGWRSTWMVLFGQDRVDRRVILDFPTIVEVWMIMPTWRPRFPRRYLRCRFLLLNYKYCDEIAFEKRHFSYSRRLSY